MVSETSRCGPILVVVTWEENYRDCYADRSVGVTTRRDLTRDDLDAMPDDGYRYELIDGILIVSPAPGARKFSGPSETCTSLCGSLASGGP